MVPTSEMKEFAKLWATASPADVTEAMVAGITTPYTTWTDDEKAAMRSALNDAGFIRSSFLETLMQVIDTAVKDNVGDFYVDLAAGLKPGKWAAEKANMERRVLIYVGKVYGKPDFLAAATSAPPPPPPTPPVVTPPAPVIVTSPPAPVPPTVATRGPTPPALRPTPVPAVVMPPAPTPSNPTASSVPGGSPPAGTAPTVVNVQVPTGLDPETARLIELLVGSSHQTIVDVAKVVGQTAAEAARENRQTAVAALGAAKNLMPAASPAPVVNVPPAQPVVNVPSPDLSRVNKGMGAITVAAYIGASFVGILVILAIWFAFNLSLY